MYLPALLRPEYFESVRLPPLYSLYSPSKMREEVETFRPTPLLCLATAAYFDVAVVAVVAAAVVVAFDFGAAFGVVAFVVFPFVSPLWLFLIFCLYLPRPLLLWWLLLWW